MAWEQWRRHGYMDIWDLHNLIKFLVLWVAQEHPRGGLAARKHSHELCELTPGSQTGNDSQPSANTVRWWQRANWSPESTALACWISLELSHRSRNTMNKFLPPSSIEGLKYNLGLFVEKLENVVFFFFPLFMDWDLCPLPKQNYENENRTPPPHNASTERYLLLAFLV